MKRITFILAFTLVTSYHLGLNAQCECGTKITGIDSIYSPSNPFVLAFHNDSNTTLFIAGGFVNVNTTLANNIFNWNGLGFSVFNQGMTSAGIIKTLITYKNKLYMGGGFNEVDNQPGTANLAIWDGANWNGCPIGEPHGGEVYDMTIYHDTLFICGRFWNFGDVNDKYRQLVGTDGTNWFKVGSTNWPHTSSIIEFNDRLYVGGYYGMMEYKGDTIWEVMSPGPIDFVNDMDVDTFNNFLYTGGFIYLGNISFNTQDGWLFDDLTECTAAYYDGFEWNSMGTEVTAVYEQGVKFYHGDVYMGGSFSTLQSGLRVNNIAKWNGTQWDSIQCNLNGEVEALEVFQDTLYIGGYFTAADGTPADGIVKYFSPDTGCHYMQPRVLAVNDTFKINNLQPTVEVQFYNNNAYADGWDWDFDDGQAQIPVYTQNASHVFDTPGSYQVSVTVNHQGCTKTASKVITIINNTGTEEYTRENLQFKLYPNPTSGEVTVECTLPADKIGELRTHQVNGSWKKRYALQGGFNQIVIPENEVSSGISMVSLFVDGEFVLGEKVVRR